MSLREVWGDAATSNGPHSRESAYDLMANFCLLGTLAHNGMLNMGRGGGDWASHYIENKLLSGAYDIAHGEGLSIIIPAYLKHIARKKSPRLKQFETEVISIENLEAFYKSLSLPTRLSDMNISADDVRRLVKTIFPPDTILGGYGKLTPREIEDVIELAR